MTSATKDLDVMGKAVKLRAHPSIVYFESMVIYSLNHNSSSKHDIHFCVFLLNRRRIANVGHSRIKMLNLKNLTPRKNLNNTGKAFLHRINRMPDKQSYYC